MFDRYTYVCTRCGNVLSFAREVSARELSPSKVHHGEAEDQDHLEMDDRALGRLDALRRGIREACTRYGVSYAISTGAVADCQMVMRRAPEGMVARKDYRQTLAAAAVVRGLLLVYAQDYEAIGTGAARVVHRKAYDGTDVVYSPF